MSGGAKNGFYPGLQGLRAIAASLVVVQHSVYFSCLASGANSDRFLLLEFGNIGVFIFFVISGAVMALITTNEGPATYALSRLLRIYPAYFLALAFAFIVLSIAGKPPMYTPDVSLLLIPSGNLNGTFEVPYWTLVYEMQFYFLLWLAALSRASHKTRIMLALAWATLILFVRARGIDIPVASPAVMQILFGTLNMFFIFGYVLASALMTKDWRPLFILIAGVVVSSLYLSAWPEHYVVQAVLCVSAVFVALSVGPATVPKWLAKMGDYSYGLYLVHLPIVVAIYLNAATWPIEVTTAVTLVCGGLVGLSFGAFEQWLHRRYLKPIVGRKRLGAALNAPVPAVADQGGPLTRARS